MNSLLIEISRNRLTLFVTSIVSLIITISTLFFGSFYLTSVQEGNLIWDGVEALKSNQSLGVVTNYLITIITAFALYKLSEHFTLNPVKSYLPYLLYCLMQLSNPQLQFISEGSFAAIFITTAIIMLFAAYQKKYAAPFTFLIGNSVGILALFWTKSLLYFPLFMIGLWLMRCLTLRSFLSLILGVGSILWLQLSYFFFIDQSDLFLAQFEVIGNLSIANFNQIALFTRIQIILTFLIGVVMGTKLLISNFKEKVRTQACYNFVILLSTIASVLALLDAEHITGHLTIMYLTVSLLAANLFTKLATKGMSVLFIIILLLYSTSYILSLWSN